MTHFKFRKSILALMVAGVMLAPTSVYASDAASADQSVEKMENVLFPTQEEKTQDATAGDSTLEATEETSEEAIDGAEGETLEGSTEAIATDDASEADSSEEESGVPFSTVESVEQAMNGVVQVNTVFEDDKGNKHIIYGGTGILIGSAEETEYIITNNHIVNPDRSLKRAAYKYYKISNKDNAWDNIKPYTEVVFENDMTVKCTEVNSSENLDLCVLSIAQPNLNRTPLTLLVQDPGDKTKPYKTTDAVYALGFPEGISYEKNEYYAHDRVTMTQGVVATVSDYNGADLIQHTAEINKSNCGGPLLNADGLVIGMNEYVEDSNNYFSLDSTVIANMLDSLGIQYTKMTKSDYEIWIHRNDPKPEEVPVVPTPWPTPDPDPQPTPIPGWLIAAVIVLTVLVLALIALAVVMIIKQHKANMPPEKLAEIQEKKEKKKAEKIMPQMKPIENIPNYSGSMETGVIGHDENTGATTLLNPGMGTPPGEPLITSGTLIRRKNSDNIIVDKQSFSIGKDSLHVDYCIKDNPAVSRTHATINTVNNEVFIQDCHSTNGTFVNGNRLEAGASEKLKDGDVIKIADEEFQYRI